MTYLGFFENLVFPGRLGCLIPSLLQLGAPCLVRDWARVWFFLKFSVFLFLDLAALDDSGELVVLRKTVWTRAFDGFEAATPRAF